MFGNSLINLGQWGYGAHNRSKTLQSSAFSMHILVNLDGLVMHFEKLYVGR